MMSSLMPSEKYSCSGSPDMLVNGKTAIDGVSTLGVELAALDRLVAKSVLPGCHFQTRIGRSIFFTVMSPPSKKRTSIRLPTLSLTIEETQIPPGSASGSKRAAMLTPSPYRSSFSMMTSPRLMPIRSTMVGWRAVASRNAAPERCTESAQFTASTTLPNSTMVPSPISFTMRPLWAATAGLKMVSRWRFRAANVPASSAPIRRE